MNRDATIRSLKMQLLVERSVIGIILLIFLGRFAFGHLFNAPYAIEVNGKPVAYVATKQAAEKVIADVKKGSNTKFKEDVRIARGSKNAKLMNQAEGEKALAASANRMVEAYVIFVDGKPSVAVPSEEMSSEVLNKARDHFGMMVKNLMELPTFKQNVKVESTMIEEKNVKTNVDDAVRVLISGTSASKAATSQARREKHREHVVQEGQLAINIAEEYGLNLDQLEQLNPGRDLAKLQIGDKLIVGKVRSSDVRSAETSRHMAAPRLIVVVRDSISRTEPIPYSTQTISSVQLPQGKRLVLSPGRTGLREVKRAVTYENGVKTGSEIVEENIIRAPVPERVAVGI